MPKKRWKKKGLESAPVAQADADPTTRSIAVCDNMVAVAAGRRWRVVDIRSGEVLQDNNSHEGAVRGLAFSPDGSYLVTCGDDKTACVWRTSDWTCLHRLKCGKKATACAFSADSRHVFTADRFGDVLCAAVTAESAPAAPAAELQDSSTAALPAAVEAQLLLGHLQCIVTSLTTCGSSSGRPLLISTDKDGKVRSSVLPADPTKGSYDIQSYCLGHTKFATCSAAVPQPASSDQQQQQHLILSGSGDGTVRLWDVDSGKQLCCYVASEQPPSLAFQRQQQEAGGAPETEQQQQQVNGGDDGSGDEADEQQQQQQGEEEHDAAATATATAAAAEPRDGSIGPGDQPDQQQEHDGSKQAAAAGDAGDGSNTGRGRYHKLREACCAVLSVAVSLDSTTVAVAVEGHQELQLLSLDAAAGQLQLQQKLSFEDVVNPAALAFDNQGRLWVAGGVLARGTASAHVAVAAKNTEGDAWQPVTATVLGGSLRPALELRVQGEEDKQQQEQEGYYFEGFKRAVYVVEEGAQKRRRRDLRDIERLRALAAAQDQEREQQKQQQTEQGAGS